MTPQARLPDTDRLPATAEELAACLAEARRRTLDLVADLEDGQLVVPHLEIVNPFLWELGHVAWFQERWILRHLGGEAPGIEAADERYNSVDVAHDTRWALDLPDRATTLDYMAQVLERTLERLGRGEPTAEERDVYRLVLFHEDMHGEAFFYMRQTLGYGAPPRETVDPEPVDLRAGGDLEHPGGDFRLGAEPDADFAFDNERWAHGIELEPFALAQRPVSQGEYRAFVEDGGYRRRDLWTAEGWAWREAEGAEHPVYWRRGGTGEWSRRRFDRWVDLEPDLPLHHVNAFEAEAYSAWAGRRLPTEAEWEAAQSAGAWDLGTGFWEWTASSFGPYPGFEAGLYREYSQPWFAGHRVLRGGAHVTRRRLLWPTWRNFYTPDRRDVLAGLRTAALR